MGKIGQKAIMVLGRDLIELYELMHLELFFFQDARNRVMNPFCFASDAFRTVLTLHSRFSHCHMR